MGNEDILIGKAFKGLYVTNTFCKKLNVIKLQTGSEYSDILDKALDVVFAGLPADKMATASLKEIVDDAVLFVTNKNAIPDAGKEGDVIKVAAD